MNISLSAFAPENLVSRDGFGSPIPCQPAHLHIQAESGAYLRDSSRLSCSKAIHVRNNNKNNPRFTLPCSRYSHVFFEEKLDASRPSEHPPAREKKRRSKRLGGIIGFFLFLYLTCSRWTSSLPSCLWSLRIFPSVRMRQLRQRQKEKRRLTQDPCYITEEITRGVNIHAGEASHHIR